MCYLKNGLPFPNTVVAKKKPGALMSIMKNRGMGRGVPWERLQHALPWYQLAGSTHPILLCPARNRWITCISDDFPNNTDRACYMKGHIFSTTLSNL